jgi:hypothetical protein
VSLGSPGLETPAFAAVPEEEEEVATRDVVAASADVIRGSILMVHFLSKYVTLALSRLIGRE